MAEVQKCHPCNRGRVGMMFLRRRRTLRDSICRQALCMDACRWSHLGRSTLLDKSQEGNVRRKDAQAQAGVGLVGKEGRFCLLRP